MLKYRAFNIQDHAEQHLFFSVDMETARHKVINSLDMSKEWCIERASNEFYPSEEQIYPKLNSHPRAICCPCK